MRKRRSDYARVQRPCPVCGASVEVQAHEVGAERYCSRGCRAAAQMRRVACACGHCGACFDRPASAVRSVNFCSPVCRAAGMDHRVRRSCAACGAPIVVQASELRPANYCSRACRSAGLTKRVERVCATCGTVFARRPSVVGPVNYCSRPCFAASVRGQPPSAATMAAARLALVGRPNPEASLRNKARTGAKHPLYKAEVDSDRLGRQRAQQTFPAQPCAVCGRPPEQVRIHRHHVDENPRNNDPANIQFLCGAHHLAEHQRRRREAARPQEIAS